MHTDLQYGGMRLYIRKRIKKTQSTLPCSHTDQPTPPPRVLVDIDRSQCEQLQAIPVPLAEDAMTVTLSGAEFDCLIPGELVLPEIVIQGGTVTLRGESSTT